VSDAAKTYAYDQRGNLLLEQDRASGARSVYTWNIKNQLLRLDFFADAVAQNPNRTITFSYDPLGRRASKTDGSSVQRFVYDGADLIGIQDAANNVQAATVFAEGIDEPLGSITPSGTKLYFKNQLGSITAVAQGGSLTHQYRYGPHGQTMPGSSADSLPFRYTGREKDTESLYYYRARYYSTSMPRCGRLCRGIRLGWKGESIRTHMSRGIRSAAPTRSGCSGWQTCQRCRNQWLMR
jgi:YD repeat-containing protein